MITICPECDNEATVIQIDNGTPFRCGYCQNVIKGRPAKINIVVSTVYSIEIFVPEELGKIGAESLGFDFQTTTIKEWGELEDTEIEHTTFLEWTGRGEGK